MSTATTNYPERPEADFSLPESGYRVCAAVGCTIRKWHSAGVRNQYGIWYCSPQCLPSYSLTSCAQCSQVVPMAFAFITAKHTGRGTMVEHFCSETCANEFYLERLRGGL